MKNLRVGAGRCAGPRASSCSWLMVLEMPNQPRVALARWIHHVCAEVAGCYANSSDSAVRLGFSVTNSGCVGRPSPMVNNFDSIYCGGNAIVDGARPDSRRMVTDFQNLITGQTG